MEAEETHEALKGRYGLFYVQRRPNLTEVITLLDVYDFKNFSDLDLLVVRAHLVHAYNEATKEVDRRDINGG